MDNLMIAAEKRLSDLQAGYQKQIADIHAQEGAIQECQFWIETLKQSLKNEKE